MPCFPDSQPAEAVDLLEAMISSLFEQKLKAAGLDSLQLRQLCVLDVIIFHYYLPLRWFGNLSRSRFLAHRHEP